jgi:ubiquinone/menaquinone biosynthesis C-methylase UbiE
VKIRESGMPQEEEWSGFFKPIKILKLLGVNQTIVDLVDFGCGYGTFTIPAARMIRGKLYAIDIDPKMIKVVQQKAQELNLHNIINILRDFISEGSGLGDLSVDYVMLFNILHGEKPKVLLKEAYRILKPNGKLAIVHWNYDAKTPRGPPMDIRYKPSQVKNWAESVGFIFEKKTDLKPYHYAIMLTKNKVTQNVKQ